MQSCRLCVCVWVWSTSTHNCQYTCTLTLTLHEIDFIHLQQQTVGRNGHIFQLITYKTPTMCDLCGTMLWGVIYHGFQCTACEINIHRYCCVNEVAECAGQIKHKQWPRKLSAHRLKINRKYCTSHVSMFRC